MSALENERRRILEHEEVLDMIRAQMGLPSDAEVIERIDGTFLVIWSERLGG